MKDVFGMPQSLLIIGGNSEIALAIVKELMKSQRITDIHVVTRSGAWLYQDLLAIDSPEVKISTYKLSTFSVSRDLLETEIDLCVIATGFLPLNNSISAENIGESLSANLVIPIRLASEVSDHMQKQAHGVIVGLSSIAAVRIRPDNWIYGLTKQGFDIFLGKLAESLYGSGVTVLTIRSGMVRTKMSRHLKEAPLTVDPEDVAIAVVKKLKDPSSIVWVPKKLKVVGLILRILPIFVLKRLHS